MKLDALQQPKKATAALVLRDGTVFWGKSLGKKVSSASEICFNTGLTGYQEVLTDPSYAGQSIVFTFPHIGIVGANAEDMETSRAKSKGAIFSADITTPSSWRAEQDLDSWLQSQDLPAIAGIDTRRLTRLLRDGGAQDCVILHGDTDGKVDLSQAEPLLDAWTGLEGLDLAAEVGCKEAYAWDDMPWSLEGSKEAPANRKKVVAVDFGAKDNILRCLVAAGCDVTVVPAQTTAEEILALAPQGVFLSNGPGDPAATGAYAVPMIQGLMAASMPIFGICLGHQLLARALGASTKKMHMGHRGANHPVQELATGKVEITSQNHGFAVDADSLPAGVTQTHISLFDKTNEGLECPQKRVFSVQYHPEASPGPQDSQHLFNKFFDLMA